MYVYIYIYIYIHTTTTTTTTSTTTTTATTTTTTTTTNILRFALGVRLDGPRTPDQGKARQSKARLRLRTTETSHRLSPVAAFGHASNYTRSP